MSGDTAKCPTCGNNNIEFCSNSFHLDTAKQGEKERIKTGDELAKIFHEQVDRIKKETWNAAIDECIRIARSTGSNGMVYKKFLQQEFESLKIKRMTQQQFNNLNPGDIVKGKLSEETYVVTCHYGNRVTAVRTEDITNPDEWQLILQAKHVKP